MSGVERVDRVEGLHGAVPYAYATIAPPGAALVHLAGACPIDEDGRTVAAGDLAGQTARCLENMKAALAAAGAGTDDVVFLRVVVASSMRTDLAAVWDLVHEDFGARTPPGTLMGTTVLGWPDQLVEIEAVAAIVSRSA